MVFVPALASIDDKVSSVSDDTKIKKEPDKIGRTSIIPVTDLIDHDTLNAIIERTKVGGGELVKLMGTSAWYAPGAAAAQMVEAIVCNHRRVFPVCALLNGEYGMNNIYLGVPVILGKNGIEKIIEVKLDKDEQELLAQSAKAVRSVMDVLDNMKLF